MGPQSVRSESRRRYAAGAAVALATLTALVGVFAAIGLASPAGNAAQQQYGPANTVAPSISGSPAVGQTLTANPGTWTGATPISFTYQWERCTASATSCIAISGATRNTYQLVAADRGARIRVAVRAANPGGTATAVTAPTDIVQDAGPAGVITLPNGEKSIPVTSVPITERLIVNQVSFSPSPITSRVQPIQIRVKVKDTRGYVVRGARVFVRSTPVVTTAAPQSLTADNGTVIYTVQPESDFPSIRNGYSVQFFVKAFRDGDNPLGGIAGYRLVQVPLSTR